MVMDQIKQIDQNQDNNINTQELLDAIKPNWFLSNMYLFDNQSLLFLLS